MKLFSVFVLLVVLALDPVLTSPTPDKISKEARSHGIAFDGQFPSSASIYIQAPSGTFFCGGTLISELFVLTTASCIQGAVLFTVRLGSSSLGSDDLITVVADTYCLHPDYESSTLQNNLGLIQFREPVKDVEYVRPAYLPTEPLDPESIYVAVSWGSFTSGNGNDLNYATVTIVPNDECMVKSDSLACGVSEDDEGLCWGTMGNAMLTVLDAKDQWVMGVASFGLANACSPSDPYVYVPVFPFVDWIKAVTGIE
ncbi:brachyurin-like [Zophobas morio]|uniref:brachyurin-like n=1 Tax=Zophobas morio TaxID=2755281 RepID=UPI0030838843